MNDFPNKKITRKEIDQLNKEGWNSPIGKMYHAVNPIGIGKRTAYITEEKFISNIKKYHEHYTFIGKTDASNMHEIWFMFQNLEKAHKWNNRSMKMFDLILYDGDLYYVDSIGFPKIANKSLIALFQAKIKKQRK